MPRESHQSLEKLISVYGDQCHWCGIQVVIGAGEKSGGRGGALHKATREHLKPYVRGGCGCLANMRVACMGCNSTRGADWDLVNHCERHADREPRGYPGMATVAWRHLGDARFMYDNYTEAS